MILGSCPPRPSAESAHVSSTTSWARRNRDHHGPVRDGATLRPIGAYRALSSTAATTAAASVPPAPRIEAAANWAEPANVVADITIGAIEPIVGRARTPNEIPKPSTAIENGATFLAPWAKLREPPGSSIGWRTLSAASP